MLFYLYKKPLIFLLTCRNQLESGNQTTTRNSRKWDGQGARQQYRNVFEKLLAVESSGNCR